MSIYTGVGSKARQVSKMYVGVGGKARQVTKAYVGVGGKARLIYNYGTPLSSLDIGRSVWIAINGTYYPFRVIHHGNPSTSIYDASCNGTWLMGDVYSTNSTDTNYAGNVSISTKYLNTTFLNSIDAGVRNLIKQVKIPYATGRFANDQHILANGLSTKIFALSYYEVGGEKDSYIGVDGAVLSMFRDGGATAQSQRISFDLSAGKRSDYWLRSTQNGGYPYYVTAEGELKTDFYYQKHGILPAFILPSDATVDPDTLRVQT